MYILISMFHNSFLPFDPTENMVFTANMLTIYRHFSVFQSYWTASMIKEDQVDLPEASSITLIPNMDEGDDTDGDSDDEEMTEPKSINRFGAGVINSQVEIDFVDNQEEELPDITQ